MIFYIKNIFFGLTLGIFASLLIMQRDPRILQSVQEYVCDEFGKAGACTMRGTVCSVNLLSPSLTMTNVIVESKQDNDWRWTADTMHVKCHWISIILHRAFDMHITLENFNVFSKVKDHICLIVNNHFNTLLNGPPLALPLIPSSIICSRASIRLEHEKGITLDVLCEGTLKKRNEYFDASLNIVHGSVWFKDRYLLQELKGTLDAKIQSDAINSITLNGMCAVDLPTLNNRNLILHGSWANCHGKVHVHNKDNSFNAQCDISKQEDGFHIQALSSLPLDVIIKYLPCEISWLVKNGTCTIKSQVHVTNEVKFEGKLVCEDFITTTTFPITSNLTFAKDKDHWYGDIVIMAENKEKITGTWQWNNSTRVGKGKIEAKEVIALPVPKPLSIGKGSFFTLNYTDEQKISGSYACTIATAFNNSWAALEGSYKSDMQEIHTWGKLNGKKYEISMALYPYFKLLQFNGGSSHKPEFTFKSNDDSSLSGSFSMSSVQQLCEQFFGVCPSSEGTIMVDVALKNPFCINFNFKNGALRIPHTYNVLHALSGTIELDWFRKQLVIKNLFGSLYKGTIKINHAVCNFDATLQPIFMHIPVLVESCLLNLNKDLFALVSGNFIWRYEVSKQPELKGHCILEHAQMKENIFSENFQRKIFKQAGSIMNFYQPEKIPDMQCDISLSTLNPIHIKTSFLEIGAKAHLTIANTLKEPHVAGDVTIVSGTLFFPYKPLTITHGALYFSPHSLYEPHVELVAKNSIKKHIITLQVTGTVTNPHIMLEASPFLTEEQIIGLLLVGSPQQSLNSVMPALLMNNIGALIFGDQSQRALDTYFKNLIKPFKSIHLVPSFSDQTGRGGLRGAIEIEVSDRLNALIQKNFSLTEDTRFELEYLLSDDIRLKAFRDERKDAGGEVEMKWKF